MKLIAQLKLQPTPEQDAVLKSTLETTNAACNYISDIAWERHIFRKFELQRLCYFAVRQTFDLSAQMTILAIYKVADAYKLDKTTRRTFKPHGSIAYDDRILSWNMRGATVSIWTMSGRQSMPFVTGERQMKMLQTRMGETDLVYRRGAWYLLATCDVQEPDPQDIDDVIGVDLGVVNIAVSSDGTVYSSKAVNNVRYRHRLLRQRLQAKRTLAAKRRLKKLSGKERDFGKNTNHVISKQIVEQAQRTKRGIALEDLKDITKRVRVKRPQRAQLKSWSFAQLRAFIAYKAQRLGVPVVFVDPRNTSRTCPICGCIDKRNRPSQAKFSCIQCGHAGLADSIASLNIRILGRASVSRPHVSDTRTAVAPETSPAASALGYCQ